MKAVRKIGRQIAQIKRDLKTALKEINAQAARKVAQGNYAASQEMVALAKAVQQFTSDTKAFNDRWNAISKQKGTLRAEATPVWEYYRLVARAIVNSGGECGLQEIISWIESNALSDLKPGDVLDGPKGQPMWHRAVLKAKRPMVKEGFIEAISGKWKLTKSGKNLAAQLS